ncbi:hypothetical protein LCGC14_0404130 [marine sediment metagenome]|uniref:Uncharacterized protein n=1 Tax=marine sediment metagenome TaxID=412755 RepID=A0A0F9T1I5_9ZZZZ
MAKIKVKLNGRKVTIDTNRPKVAKAVAALVEACATRTFPIGMVLRHANGSNYQLASIVRFPGGTKRAYLVNTDTGRSRNSTKVVPVMGDFHSEEGLYTEDLPDQKDKFVDPDGDGYEYISRD